MDDVSEKTCLDYDALEAEDLPNDLEREERSNFVRPVYQGQADRSRLFETCEAQCRRRKRCCYLDAPCKADDTLQPASYNLRVRFMPLCIARRSVDENDRLLDYLRWQAEHFLQ